MQGGVQGGVVDKGKHDARWKRNWPQLHHVRLIVSLPLKKKRHSSGNPARGEAKCVYGTIRNHR